MIMCSQRQLLLIYSEFQFSENLALAVAGTICGMSFTKEVMKCTKCFGDAQDIM